MYEDDVVVNVIVSSGNQVLVSSLGLQGPPGIPGTGAVTGSFYPSNNPSGFLTPTPSGAGYQIISGQIRIWDFKYNGFSTLFLSGGQLVVSPIG